MAGWATWARVAARVKLPSSATATTYLSWRSSISKADLRVSSPCLGLLVLGGARSRHDLRYLHQPALRTGFAASPGGHRVAGRPAHPDRAPAPARPCHGPGAAVPAAADHGHVRGPDRRLRADAPPVPPHRPR